MARPSIYTTELGMEICRRIASGQSLREICRDDAMPDRETVRLWCINDETFFGQYARAQDCRADEIFDETLEIADDDSNDWVERDGRLVYNAEHVQRSRLRIDTRKWNVACMAPKRYGDRLALDHAGGVTVKIAAPDADL